MKQKDKVYIKRKGKILCSICKKEWKTCDCWKEVGFSRGGQYVYSLYKKNIKE